MPLDSAVPILVTIQSDKCFQRVEKGELVLDLRLPTSYLFNRRHCARLLSVSGLAAPFFVHASFVELQPFDSSFRRHLGISTETPGPLVPVEGNFISALSSLYLEPLSGQLLTALPQTNVVISIQILPVDWLKCNCPSC
jgi:hypothetical protein